MQIEKKEQFDSLLWWLEQGQKIRYDDWAPVPPYVRKMEISIPPLSFVNKKVVGLSGANI